VFLSALALGNQFWASKKEKSDLLWLAKGDVAKLQKGHII